MRNINFSIPTTATSASTIQPDETKHTIVIVGAGFAGYRIFAESLDLAIEQRIYDSVRYVIVDSRRIDEYGCGIAWDATQSEVLRANMHSTTIVFDSKGNEELISKVQDSEIANAPIGKLFATRKEVGQILHQSFLSCIHRAVKENVEFHLLQNRVENVERVGKGYSVSLTDGSTFIGHSIVLATGHFPAVKYSTLRGRKGYFDSPWQWDNIRNIEPDKKVGLLGLGPSAVDAMLVLKENGVQSIDAFSRTGRMQYPRPIPKRTELKLITSSFLREVAVSSRTLSLDTAIGLLFAEFRSQAVSWLPFLEAYEKSILPPSTALRHGMVKSNEEEAWFGLLVELERFAPLIWHLLADRDRARFKRMYGGLANLAYGMAPPQAIQVIDAIDHGILRTHGGLTSVRWNRRSRKFEVDTKRSKTTQTFKCDVLIDCTGFGSNLEDCPWLFVAPMIEQGLMVAHSQGGALANFDTGQLHDRDGRPTGEIYCLVGSLLIGEHYVTNGLGKVAESAHRTATAIQYKLHQTMRTKSP